MYEIKRGPSGLMYAQHDDGGTVNFASKWLFRMQSPSPSPVRTVTRKEIVPGVYGKISVQGQWKDKVGVAIVGNPVDAESAVTVLIGHVQLSRADLTAAINTLTQIRDALA